jgi:PAS domain S-box-containing protein
VDELTTMLAAVATSVPDAVVVAGTDGRVRYLNPAAERMFGASLAAARGEHVSAFSVPDERERSRALVARLCAGERVENAIVMQMRHQDGSCFFAEVTMSPLRDLDGALVGIVGIGRDVTRRLRAEADAARLRAIVDAANEAILGIDTDGTVLFFSPSAERLFGWPAEDIVGLSGDELVVPKYRIGPKRLFEELATHGSFRRPTVALRRDGAHVEVELSAAEIMGKDGSVAGAALTVLDVSERRRTRRLLDRIIEHAPNAIAVKDLDGRYLVFNFGAPTGERRDFTGLTDADLLPADMAARSREQDREVLERGKPMTFHDEFVSADGRRRTFVTTRFPLPGPDGETEAVGVIASDMTEMRRAEADQAQLAALVQAAPDAIVARDRDGRIVTWNPGAEAMFGIRAEDAIGGSYADLVVPEEDREPFATEVAEVQAGRTLTVRTTRRRQDGSRFPAQVSVAPLAMLDGSWHGTLSLIRDISDIVAAERELEARAAQLERSNAELERFAYAASHELQEPLQSIKLSASAVIATAEARLDEDERELIGHIDAAASRLSEQIRALMQVARVALGAGPEERVMLAVAVRDAVDALRGVAMDAGAEIVVHEPLPAVEVPRTEIALVLQNLIANAIKYRREDVAPVVEIAAVRGERSVEVRVADNGVGLSEADLERVFGLFERGEETDVPGTGMGLAVARRMLARQGGTLTARSDGCGHGSEFMLVLHT